jgi:hypothetical protein
MNNPRWTKWPFKGWREDDAVWAMFIAFMVGVLITSALLVLLQGCYADHVAEPCEEDLCEAGQCDGARQGNARATLEEVGSNPAAGHQDNCPGGVIVAYYGCTKPGDPYWRKYCEGPYAGCIAPGSPFSSTWETQR